jgi:hypothetical protein
MDVLLGGLAFAAIMFGQFAAVIAVHGENCRPPGRRDASCPDDRAKQIREGGS